MLKLYEDVYKKVDYLKEVLEKMDDKTFDVFSEDFDREFSALTKTVCAMKGFEALADESETGILPM